MEADERLMTDEFRAELERVMGERQKGPTSIQ
jgi:hypothetical protein